MIINKLIWLPKQSLIVLGSPTSLTRGAKKLAYGQFLSIGRFRARKGLPPSPCASGPLTDDPDWSYPNGEPGLMNKGQSLRYLRDQDLGRTMVKYNKQFDAIKENRKKMATIESMTSGYRTEDLSER